MEEVHCGGEGAHWALMPMKKKKKKKKKKKNKPTEKGPLGRPRSRWEDNIRMNLQEMGVNTRNWVVSARDRDYWRAFVNAVLNLRVS